jgi:UDP-glucose 4-epimerase
MVTGGCGFIGSHLVRALCARGARRVVVLDSMRYGDRANLDGAGAGVEIVAHTLGRDSPARLHESLRGVRWLFHLAAEKHNQSKDTPAEVLRSNIDGTYALFEAAARAGVEKTVFSSSLYAYGRMAGPPFDEDEPAEPRTIYGITKLCGEQLLRQVAAEHGMACNVLRYLFVYGPRQFAGTGYKSVIVRTFERLRRGEAPVVYGDGEQALDYVYVDDAIDATIAALYEPLTGAVLNIGSGTPTTVNALVAMMQRVAGTDLPVRYEPADWTAGSCRVGNIDRARRLLGWTPQITLETGLVRTYRWITARTR